MAQQMRFFRKNFLDSSYSNATISEQSSLQENGLDQMRDRSNRTAWITTGATDAETLNIVADFVDTRDINSIILVGHNLGAFTIQYDLDGSMTWTDFSTAINESSNTDSTSYFSFTTVSTRRIRLTITGTQVADAEKVIKQWIVSEQIGQLIGWPKVQRAALNQQISRSTLPSGKQSVNRNTGGFRFQAAVTLWRIEADLELLEKLYLTNQGFLVWICGGDEDQFSVQRLGYRLEDIFLMKLGDDYTPNFYKGVYTTGFQIAADFVEVID